MHSSSPVTHGNPKATANPVASPVMRSGAANGSADVQSVVQSNPQDGRKVHPSAPEQEMIALRTAATMAARQFKLLWHPLLTGIAASPDRDVAAQCIVTQIAERLPDHTVRLGWGIRGGDAERGGRLSRLLDSRLGWLGADNSIYQSLKSRLEKNPTPEELKAIVRWESANLVVELIPKKSQDAGADQETGVDPNAANSNAANRSGVESFGRIWIRPPQGDNTVLKRFAEMLPKEAVDATATVFFSRPASGQLGRIASVLSRWWSKRGTFGIAALLVLMLACIPVSYRIPAAATVTAMNSRRVAAPIDATLLVAHVQPGDRVSKGDPLIELDGRPLRIELEAITSEIAEATKDEDIGLASGQIAQAQLAGLKRKSLSRRRELITRRLSQLIVTSPIDGVVIQGDLQHSLGTPLEIGQTLLEIAPNGSLEVELEIPEVEIGFVEHNAPVEFYFPAVGRTDFRSQIGSIWPSATIRDDENVFIAKTPMPTMDERVSVDHDMFLEPETPMFVSQQMTNDETSATELRVGMRGEAVVLGPTRPWVWKWVRVPLRKIGWVVGW
ncbi:multidrug efflux pump subunit AcrA (membrane-fusion protein) [Rhodopirellula rubra]|uniref:Multidrug efflux pump subunit AcrA (Membrane-fusion protein) n=2 Tax=Aporhodopirellula rubra TaxID=980271 RepID=A0A7W5E247_9BACT|nr:HlyD family efflux transporter periplasmic adaptor subunit [Aporhodopirellula rubra]MBB3207902.1 multidrug efflux pump subunit AcrA (membrane-fusion protein) [Aporhodopirellula rubra]